MDCLVKSEEISNCHFEPLQPTAIFCRYCGQIRTLVKDGTGKITYEIVKEKSPVVTPLESGVMN